MMTTKEAIDFFVEDFPQYVVSDLGPSRRQMAYHMAIEALKNQESQRWTPVTEKLPELDDDGYSDKVLVSFDSATLPEIGEYRASGENGNWYVGDLMETFEQYGLTVNAWKPLPKCYRRPK